MLYEIFPGLSADRVVLSVHAGRVHARDGAAQQFHVDGSRDADAARARAPGRRVRRAPLSPSRQTGGDPGDVLGHGHPGERHHGLHDGREDADERASDVPGGGDR